MEVVKGRQQLLDGFGVHRFDRKSTVNDVVLVEDEPALRWAYSLDCGCGPGSHLVILTRSVVRFNIVMIDMGSAVGEPEHPPIL